MNRRERNSFVATTDQSDLAWSAGIIDGEGCIAIKTHMPKSHQGLTRWFGLVLAVKMIHRPTIVRLQSIFDCGTIQIERRGRLRTMYRWHVSARDAAGVLMTVLPYMCTKYDEAVLALQFAEANKRTVQGRHRIVSPSVTAVRLGLMEELAALKRRRWEAA